MNRLLTCSLAVAALSSLAHAQIVKAQFNAPGPVPAAPFGISNHFGNDVVPIGDVDGDGNTDYAVADAAYHGNNPAGLNSNGAVHLFSGIGVPAPLITTLFGTFSADFFGASMAVVGDVTGDGIGELVVGAHQSGSGSGYIRCFDPTTGTMLFQANGPSAGSWYGHGLAAINDLDSPADGAADVLVLGNNFVHVRSSATGALLYQGTTNDSLNSVITHPGAVAVLDLDADGFDDYVIGSPNLFMIEAYNGNPAAYFGGFLAQVGGYVTDYGFSIAATGDVDGDGIGDLAVGAPGIGADFVDVFSGQAVGLSLPLITTIQGRAMSRYGHAVSGLGSPAGGNANMLIGRIGGGPGTSTTSGNVFVHDGSGAVLFVANPPAPPWGYGTRVVDGGPGSANPYHEFAVSFCSNAVTAPPGSGSVWVFYGAPAAATAVRGTGCGPAGPGSLSGVGVPSLGNAIFALFHAGPVTGGNGAMFIGIPSAPIPVQPGCSMYVDPATATTIGFIASSFNLIPLPIPASPALGGGVLATQAAVVTGGGTGLQLSNGLDLTLGY